MVRILLSILRAPYHPPASQKGLWGGEGIRHGFYTTKYRKHKIKRQWHPNVQRIKAYSEILNTTMRLPMTTYVMKQIDLVGGLDNYILRTSEERLHSEYALKLRKVLLHRIQEQKTAELNRYEKRLKELTTRLALHRSIVSRGKDELGAEEFTKEQQLIAKLLEDYREIEKQMGICKWEILDAKRRSLTNKEKYLQRKSRMEQKAKRKKELRKLNAQKAAEKAEMIARQEAFEPVQEKRGIWGRIRAFLAGETS